MKSPWMDNQEDLILRSCSYAAELRHDKETRRSHPLAANVFRWGLLRENSSKNISQNVVGYHLELTPRTWWTINNLPVKTISHVIGFGRPPIDADLVFYRKPKLTINWVEEFNWLVQLSMSKSESPWIRRLLPSSPWLDCSYFYLSYGASR